MDRFVGLLGVVLILGIAYALSNNRKAINYRTVGAGLGLQLFLALFILKVPVGQQIFSWLGDQIKKLLDFSKEGAEFVFGPLVREARLRELFGEDGGFIFFFQVIPGIIFMASLVAVAYHLGIMQRIINVLARGVYWLMGVSGAEALSNVSSIFVGQVEAQLMIKPYISSMTKSELLASMGGSMACIAGGIMVVYIGMGIEASYLLAASLMAAPGALVIAKIMYPETEPSATRGRVKLHVEKQNANLLDAISHGASDGMRISLNVIAMLIAFIAIVALLNGLLGGLGTLLFDAGLDEATVGFDFRQLSLESIMGVLLSGIAWCMGVPLDDVVMVGGLMGKKVIVNEFVAYTDLSHIKAMLHPKSYMILTFALCGFANLSSVGMQVGGIGQMAPERRKDLARLGFRALVCGTLASYLSATLAGIIA